MLVAHKLASGDCRRLSGGAESLAPQTPFTALALGEVVLKAGWPEESAGGAAADERGYGMAGPSARTG